MSPMAAAAAVIVSTLERRGLKIKVCKTMKIPNTPNANDIDARLTVSAMNPIHIAAPADRAILPQDDRVVNAHMPRPTATNPVQEAKSFELARKPFVAICS